ncbi:MAG: regulatory iron-sulfur-containing complex subunit RicT, partial [Chloroflexota bacterium]
LVLRLPTVEDKQRSQEFDVWTNSCLVQAQEFVSQHSLVMKLWRLEPDPDRRRFTIYFSAPARVDFRSIVRELGSRWKTKVEFRQLGARDESKVLGTLGLCGQPACCARFLGQFPAISLRMAREQNLAPNPEKLSGLCGRLFCCLGYELEHYQEASKKLPRLKQRVSTPSGPAIVIARNLMKETVTVSFEDNQTTMELPLSQISQL